MSFFHELEKLRKSSWVWTRTPKRLVASVLPCMSCVRFFQMYLFFLFPPLSGLFLLIEGFTFALQYIYLDE